MWLNDDDQRDAVMQFAFDMELRLQEQAQGLDGGSTAQQLVLAARCVASAIGDALADPGHDREERLRSYRGEE